MLERNQDLEARKLFLLVPEESGKHLKMCLEACGRLYLSRRNLSNGEDVIRHDKAQPPSHSLRAQTSHQSCVSSWQTDEGDKADTDIPIFYT